MTSSPRDRALLELADANPPAWIVTPTRRLARALTIRVAELRAERGVEVADAPKIHSIDDWLRRLGQGVLAREAASGAGRDATTGTPAGGRVLLSTHAERFLWEQVIRQATQDLPRDLLDVSSLAATAAQAWERVCLWGDPPWSDPMTQDAEAFRDWLPLFRARIASEGFVTSGELAGVVADAIREGRLDEPLPERAVAPSFERATPALKKLVEALESRGVVVTRDIVATQSQAALPAVVRAASPAAELRTVASRIRAHLAANPEARIAVLAPEPSSWGGRLERIFEEELDPAAVVAAGAASRRRFDFAEAPMLSDYALVANALDLLSLVARRNDFEVVSRVLLSEFPRAKAGKDDADASERDRARRGAVEAALRRERSATVRLAGSDASLANALDRGGLGARARAFDSLADVLGSDAGTVRSPSAWRREWTDRLKAVSWPGPLRGDIEGLVFRRWRTAMDDFAMLEVVRSSMDATEALQQLREICASTPVQPPSENHSVQVMSLLDAAGFEFDTVYAIGMTATDFPPPPRPNALLPVRWQRAQEGMPRASVEAERELAARVWARVLESAPTVVATFHAVGDGGQENVASACVAGIDVVEADPQEGRPWWIDAGGAAPEKRPDDAALVPLVRRGGSSIVRNQSDCPFRAFAAARLGAEPLAAIRPQPDSSRRGMLVHSALKHAYSEITNSIDLAGLSDDNIEDAARRAAARAVGEEKSFFEDAEDLAASTRQWLAELVAAWMRHERDVRVEPWEVELESLEADFEARFPADAADAIEFSFRPDRIDRVAGGDIVILDYKTSGSAKTGSAWAGARPAEPQLPLYLALLQQAGRKVGGIAFGNLSARDSCELVGAAALEHSTRLLPPSRKKAKTKADYEEAVDGWLAAVAGLVESYLRGDMQIDPRKPSVCEYCGSDSFCRKRELRLTEEEDGDGESDE